MPHSAATTRHDEQVGKMVASRRTRLLPWQAQFVLLAAIWGSSFVFIKVGDEALAPLQVTLGRLALTVTYVIPLCSTLEGVAILGERLTWYEPAGAMVVIFGVAASQGRLRLALPREPG